MQLNMYMEIASEAANVQKSLEENYRYLGILEADTIKEELKCFLKPSSGAKKSHQRDKHMSNTLCKVLRTIIKISNNSV